MAREVKYRRGVCVTAQYTHNAAIAEGEVLVVNKVPMIAGGDYAANQEGSYYISGGLWEGVPDAAIGGNKPVWWDDTNNKFTETSTSNQHFGLTAPKGSTDTNTKIVVRFEPQGLTGPIV